MSSVASTILDNLETKLKTIQKKDAYNVTVKVVEQFKVPNVGEPENQPSISIVPGEDPIVIRDATNVRKNFDIELYVYVVASADMEDIIQELVSDIHVLVYSPIDLGSNSLAIEILNTADFFVSNEAGDAGAVVSLQIIYYTSLAEF